MTREEAIEELKKVDTLDASPRLCKAHWMSIKALEQDDILDKIRAEIMEDIDKVQKDLIEEIDQGIDIGLQMALDTVNKYKAESEDKE